MLDPVAVGLEGAEDVESDAIEVLRVLGTLVTLTLCDVVTCPTLDAEVASFSRTVVDSGLFELLVVFGTDEVVVWSGFCTELTVTLVNVVTYPTLDAVVASFS